MVERNSFVTDYENKRRFTMKSADELRVELLQGENWLDDKKTISMGTREFMNENDGKTFAKTMTDKNSQTEQTPVNRFEFRKNLFERLGLRDNGKLPKSSERTETSR